MIEKMLKILELALEICPPEVSDIGMKKTAVFVEYAPHCNGFSVQIYGQGWTKTNKPDYSRQVFLDLGGAEEKLDLIINEVMKYREE